MKRLLATCVFIPSTVESSATTRFLRVWLPPGYDDAQNAARQFPVLYLNDGQNLFEPATSFNGVEWQVDETADRLIREYMVRPLIIVGIDNAGKDRVREYMPHRSFQPMMLRVQGTRYPSFLIKEVMPFVGRHYRVASGPRNTGLGGSSLGALIALYTVAVSPGIFGRLLLESPSLWAANRQIIRQSRTVRRWPERVFLATGSAEAGREDRDRSMVDDVQELAAILQRSGLTTAACAWSWTRALLIMSQRGHGVSRTPCRSCSQRAS